MKSLKTLPLDPIGLPRLTIGETSRVARAWRVVMAHLRLGEVPLEALDLPSREHVADEEGIDAASEDSFPASDPPAWTSSRS